MKTVVLGDITVVQMAVHLAAMERGTNPWNTLFATWVIVYYRGRIVRMLSTAILYTGSYGRIFVAITSKSNLAVLLEGLVAATIEHCSLFPEKVDVLMDIEGRTCCTLSIALSAFFTWSGTCIQIKCLFQQHAPPLYMIVPRNKQSSTRSEPSQEALPPSEQDSLSYSTLSASYSAHG